MVGVVERQQDEGQEVTPITTLGGDAQRVTARCPEVQNHHNQVLAGEKRNEFILWQQRAMASLQLSVSFNQSEEEERSPQGFGCTLHT